MDANSPEEMIPLKEREEPESASDRRLRDRERSANTVIVCKFVLLLTIAAFLLGVIFLGGFLTGKTVFSSTKHPAPLAQGPDWGAHVTVGDDRVPVVQWLDTELEPDNIRENLRELTKKPHVAGNVSDIDVAQLVYERWKGYKFDKLELFNYTVLLQYPGNYTRPNQLQLQDSAGKVVYSAHIQQEKPLLPLEEDPSVAPPFNAYSGMGNATGPLVYVNYGRLNDFLYLNSTLNINLDGHICIARYGGIFRGDKARLAQQYGCKGLLLYTDPAEYAPRGGPLAFPDGTSLPPSGVQRGSLLVIDGDPLTPGIPAIPGVNRRSYEEVVEEGGAPSIPVQPLSYEDAIHFMRQLSVHLAPANWTGQLNLSSYYILQADNNTNVTYIEVNNYLINKTITNVIATIYGAVEPDRYVLLGNHHDAWTFGAADPNSGTAALMELGRAFDKLLNANWRPGRTVILCSWDAEEYGVIGSYEWVEEYSKLLSANSVAYLNLDNAVSGSYSFKARSSPLLYQVLYSVTKMTKCPAPEFDTVYDQWLHYYPDPFNSSQPEIPAPLGGSDYVPFFQGLGISSVDMSYNYLNNTLYPVYHSVHDNFFFEANLTDPAFAYHTTVGLVWGKVALMVATSPVMPFDPRDYSAALSNIFSGLEEQYGADLSRQNISLDYLSDSVEQFTASADQLWAELQKASGDPSDLNRLRTVNYQLMQLERAFIIPEGLPGRPYFKHVVFSPSLVDQYGTESPLFPGVSDAIFSALEFGGSWDVVRRQLDLVRVHLLYASHIMSQPYGTSTGTQARDKKEL